MCLAYQSGTPSEKVKVPTVKSGEFNEWFNSLSVDELDELWKNKSTRKAIERQLRAPGGMHEWHLVSRAPQFKYWGVNAEQIRDLRTVIMMLNLLILWENMVNLDQQQLIMNY